jgi:hypothetical protein
MNLFTKGVVHLVTFLYCSHMDEIYCDECGAQFRNSCYCDGYQPEPEVTEVWRGMDGHKYIGDPKRPSSAYHADDCGCPGSTNFDPDSWY